MNRKIKFRAWDKKEKKFLPYEIFPYPATYGGNGTDVILQQYTGLLDKNGVEIYEGDIIKEEGEFIDYDGIRGEVVFGKIGYDGKLNGLTGFGFKKNKDDFIELYYQSIYNDEPEKYEVIGNIYENPEIL